MNTATITYNDGADPEEIVGYDQAILAEGVVTYVWPTENRVLIIPLHRVALIDSYET